MVHCRKLGKLGNEIIVYTALNEDESTVLTYGVVKLQGARCCCFHANRI